MRLSRPGGQISVGFVASSRYVPSFLPSTRRLLTFCLQTELAANSNVDGPAVLHSISDTHAIISELWDNVSNPGAPEDSRDVLNTDSVVSSSARPHAIPLGETHGRQHGCFRHLPPEKLGGWWERILSCKHRSHLSVTE